jgi:trans-aconitate methyltransferase
LPTVTDSWESAKAYHSFMGRWSRLAAQEFVAWLDPATRLHWLDLGCGTGALTAALLDRAEPASILACDPAESLLGLARQRIRDRRVVFRVAGSAHMVLSGPKLNAFVSGLVLNFIDDPETSIRAIGREMSSDGVVAAYVWDYAEGMELLRVFWDAASDLDSNAIDLDEGKRFPICAPDPLRSLFQTAGLKNVEVAPLYVTTSFEGFSDYWDPLLGATGPAPSYVHSLRPDEQRELRERLRARLTSNGDGRFTLGAKAWAVRGIT